VRLLLDTHAFIWFASGDARLSQAARDALLDEGNPLYLSVASLWEMAIKASLGKLWLAEPLEAIVARQVECNGLRILAVEAGHAMAVAGLAWHHRDPFDRLIVAQASMEQMVIVGCDNAMDAYGVRRIW